MPLNAAPDAGGTVSPSPEPVEPRVWVERLRLTNFRNYTSLGLSAGPEPIVLTGPNGSGKTNLLEAVSLLTAGQGLRRSPFPELARVGSPDWAVAATLRTLLAHPIGRDRVSDALATVLPTFDSRSQIAACETLAHLEARRSVPALVELLFVPIPEVRQAAWSALRALTGQELPAEPQIWEEYAFG